MRAFMRRISRTSASDSGVPRMNSPASSRKAGADVGVAGYEAAPGQGLAFPDLRPAAVVALEGLEAAGQGTVAALGPQREVELVEPLDRCLAVHQLEERLGQRFGVAGPTSCRRRRRPGRRGRWHRPARPRRSGPWPPRRGPRQVPSALSRQGAAGPRRARTQPGGSATGRSLAVRPTRARRGLAPAAARLAASWPGLATTPSRGRQAMASRPGVPARPGPAAGEARLSRRASWSGCRS